MMQPQRMPRATSRSQTRNGVSSRAISGRAAPPRSWFQMLASRMCKRIHVPCFDVPTLWSLVTAALGIYTVANPALQHLKTFAASVSLMPWAAPFPLRLSLRPPKQPPRQPSCLQPCPLQANSPPLSGGSKNFQQLKPQTDNLRP